MKGVRIFIANESSKSKDVKASSHDIFRADMKSGRVKVVDWLDIGLSQVLLITAEQVASSKPGCGKFFFTFVTWFIEYLVRGLSRRSPCVV